MYKNTKSKKGFTILELIIVMAVMAIFVLAAVPKFMGHTQRAKLTSIVTNTKHLEGASERYYLETGDWPRLTDTPYNSEQLTSYSNEILDITGEIANLDPDGNYYDVDYSKISRYMSKPKDGVKYILQNPVGKVFYLDKLTPEGEEHIDEVTKKNPDVNVGDSGITYGNESSKTTTATLNKTLTNGRDKMYDGDLNTSYYFSSGTETITWDGDMTNRVLRVTLSSQTTFASIQVLDANNNKLNFIVNDENIADSYSSPSSKKTMNIIIPEGATHINFNAVSGNRFYIYEIEDFTDKTLPETPTMVTINPNEITIDLSWTNPIDSDFSKVLIYRGNTYAGSSTNGTFLDKPLYENCDYTYTLYAQDITGNISNGVKVNTKTLKIGVAFRGLSEIVFDKDLNTNISFSGGTQTLTWDDDMTNRVIKVTLSSQTSFASIQVLSAGNTILSSYGAPTTKKTMDIIIPEGTTHINFNAVSGNRFYIYEIE